jgi:hypothetical protein
MTVMMMIILPTVWPGFKIWSFDLGKYLAEKEAN